MVEEGLVRLGLVLIAKIEVSVGQQALGGQQVEGFVAGDGCTARRPDVNG